MKLGNYYQKSVPVKRNRETSIIVTNDRIKKTFDDQLKIKEDSIKELEMKLKKVEDQVQAGIDVYDDLQKRHTKILLEKREYDEQNAEVFNLRTELGKTKQIADQVQILQPQIDKLSEDKDIFLTQRNAFEQQSIEFKKQAIESSNLYTDLKEEYNNLQTRLSVYEHKHPATIKENVELRSQAAQLAEQNEQQNNDISLLTTNFFYWKDAATSLEEQLTQEAILRDELQRGLELLKKGNQLSSKKITKSGIAYKEAQEEIISLNNRNLELTKFTDQMSKIIVEQRRKLTSAGQLSQGQIGAMEGFNIPFAKENLRTKQLGNAKPTLLKFKETKNDNN